jgi:hypothetical protein
MLNLLDHVIMSRRPEKYEDASSIDLNLSLVKKKDNVAAKRNGPQVNTYGPSRRSVVSVLCLLAPADLA